MSFESRAPRSPHEPKRIRLDTYNGSGAGFMRLKEDVAAGYMRVSDMRHDVVVVSMPHSRTTEYDQVGNTATAKFLSVPRFGFGDGNGTKSVRDGKAYVVGVDGEALADQVSRKTDGKKDFNDRFTSAFNGEVKKGLNSALLNEKLLNANHLDLSFLGGYAGILVNDVIPLSLLAGTFGAIENLSESITIVSNLAQIIGGLNFVWNGFNFALDKYFGKNQSANEKPFIRTDFPFGPFMPSVPIDHLVRGEWYLQVGKGRKMVERSDK